MAGKYTLVIIVLAMALILPACADNEGTQTTSPTATTPTTPTSTPNTTTPENVPGKLDMKVGQKWEFTYLAGTTSYGFNEYEVIKKEIYEGDERYFFQAKLNLESSSACKPTTFDTTYRASSSGEPVFYDKSGKIGNG